MRPLLLLPLLLAGCAQQADVAAPAPAREVRHTGSGTVLEDARHGPELCFSVAQSLPPQCGGVPLTNWDWAAVDGEESRNGVTWGDFTVVGRYDGTSLTLTEPPGPPTQRPYVDELGTPCPPPAGGWRSQDGRGGQEALGATLTAARAEADHAGAWVHEEDGVQVLTLAFTGALERHEQEARATWGGALCVVQHERTLAALQAVADDLWGRKDTGLQLTSSAVLEAQNHVELGAVAVTVEQQAELDRRYGAGTVVVAPGLTPVG